MKPIIQAIRNREQNILVVGNHTRIIQSILDFDYAQGRTTPSVAAIVSGGRKTQKLFWGNGEILLPMVDTMAAVRERGIQPDFLLNITSANSTPRMVNAFFETFPEAVGAHLFAEGVGERDALSLVERYGEEKLFAGPSGVGFCVPGALKLGTIGGVMGERVAQLGAECGAVAVICSSGGMVNELMYQVVASGAGISFAIAYGGDRFPVTSPVAWMLQAEGDPATKAIVYFGELGGRDEYAIAEALKTKKITKPVYAYIAGQYEKKDETIQFGHAKALAKNPDETAVEKSKALREAGAQVYASFGEFMNAFADLPKEVTPVAHARTWRGRPSGARASLFSSPQLNHPDATSFTEAILQRILGRDSVSKELVAFTERIFIELIDHGPQVSGAMNTIITARAGRDISSALAAGVLTIGDRFGGAINNAAKVWHTSVSTNTSPEQLVADFSARREYIPGIGHRMYSIYKPDPRVAALIAVGAGHLQEKKHITFAQAVAELTTKKKQNLILNVDGAVSALFLDYVREREGFDDTALRELMTIEFFNSLFIIPRTVGFIGHFLDQKRIDEGLFRLSDSDVFRF